MNVEYAGTQVGIESKRSEKEQAKRELPLTSTRLQELCVVAGLIMGNLEAYSVTDRERCVVRSLVEILLERR